MKREENKGKGESLERSDAEDWQFTEFDCKRMVMKSNKPHIRV